MGKALKMARQALGMGKKGRSIPGQKQSKNQNQLQERKQKQKQQQQRPEPVRNQPQHEAPKQAGEGEVFEEELIPIGDEIVTTEGPIEEDITTGKITPTSDTPSTPVPNPLPVSTSSSILLFGEGDLSFSLSLHSTHNFTNLIPTTFDPLPVLLEKYPQSTATISTLSSAGHTILHSIDATRPPKSLLKRSGTYDCIVFLFPHVGGLTKDRDRQIRANQELLLGFFKSAKTLVEPKNGVVVMGTFTGDPYDSWNIKALAKNGGFRVRRSGTFPWEAFPGYHHARTLGTIKSGGSKARGKGNGAADEGRSGVDGGKPGVADKAERKQAGWKGEDRPARLWIFEVDDGKVLNAPKNKRKRNVPAEFASDSEDEAEGEGSSKKGKAGGRERGKKLDQAEEFALAESKKWMKEQAAATWR